MQKVGVILAGGQGKRLWPLSCPGHAKQFIKLLPGEKSLFERALYQLGPYTTKPESRLIDRLVVVTDIYNEHHVRRLTQEWQALQGELPMPILILVESHGRGTAVAYFEALMGLNDDDIMVVLPSDHWFGRPLLIYKAIEKAIEFHASGGVQVTLLGYPNPELDRNMGWLEIAGHLKNNDQISSVFKFYQYPNSDTIDQWAKKFDWPTQYLANLGITIGTKKAWRHLVDFLDNDIVYGCWKYAERLWESGSDRENGATLAVEYLYQPAVAVIHNNPTIDDLLLVPNATNNLVLVQLVERGADWADLGTWPRLLKFARRMNLFTLTKGDARPGLPEVLTYAEWAVEGEAGKSFVFWNVATDDVMITSARATTDHMSGMALGRFFEPSLDHHRFTTTYDNQWRGFVKGDTIEPWGIQRQDGNGVLQLSVMPGCRMPMTRSINSDYILVTTGGLAGLHTDEQDAPTVPLTKGDAISILQNAWFSISNDHDYQPVEFTLIPCKLIRK